jgi:DNA-binding CsgD family transcriptional regulator
VYRDVTVARWSASAGTDGFSLAAARSSSRAQSSRSSCSSSTRPVVARAELVKLAAAEELPSSPGWQDYGFTGSGHPATTPTVRLMEQHIVEPVPALICSSPGPAEDDDLGPADRGTGHAPNSMGDWRLFENFIHLRARCQDALVGLSDRLMVMNSRASEVLYPCDRPKLWARAERVIRQGTSLIGELSLSNGNSPMARYQPVFGDQAVVGVLVQFSLRPSAGAGGSPSRTGAAGSVVPGWTELSNTERAVAEAVAGGLTNREAARRIFMSPHTVDAHLRNIFRKLEINSRVELARIVGEHYHELYGTENYEEPTAKAAGLAPLEPRRSA